MTGLLICAAVVVALWGWGAASVHGRLYERGERDPSVYWGLYGLALIAVALWLAYAAGGA